MAVRRELENVERSSKLSVSISIFQFLGQSRALQSRGFAGIFLDELADSFSPSLGHPSAEAPFTWSRRLFKIPAGAPSSILKITPDPLSMPAEPALVDCDIASALLLPSFSLPPLLAHLSIPPLSTFPPHFYRAPIPHLRPFFSYSFLSAESPIRSGIS